MEYMMDVMPSPRSRYPLHLPNDLKEKLEEIAEAEHRSLNAQIVYLLEKAVAEAKARE